MDHGQVGQPLADHVLGNHFAHITGPDQQGRNFSQIPVQIADQHGRHGGDGNGAFADAGFRTDPLCRDIGRLEQTFQNAVRHPALARHAVARLDLTQNLRLADDEAGE